jgi:thioredoxin 1
MGKCNRFGNFFLTKTRKSMLFVLGCVFMMTGCSNSQSGPAAAGRETTASPNEASYEATFVELGSKNCIPCKMMQPVMDNIEKNYAGKVKVVFYDVWTAEGRPYGQKYGVRAIPTQVFLDKNGEEFFRHTGFLSEEEIVKLLQKQGVTRE